MLYWVVQGIKGGTARVLSTDDRGQECSFIRGMEDYQIHFTGAIVEHEVKIGSRSRRAFHAAPAGQAVNVNSVFSAADSTVIDMFGIAE